MEQLQQPTQQLESDSTFKFVIGIGIFLSALGGLVSFLDYLERKEIARKQLKSK